MFTCKQVSKTLNQKSFNSLPLWKRILIKIHVKLCIFCGKYNKQVIQNHSMCEHFINNEDAINEAAYSCDCLDDKDKALMKSKINNTIID